MKRHIRNTLAWQLCFTCLLLLVGCTTENDLEETPLPPETPTENPAEPEQPGQPTEPTESSVVLSSPSTVSLYPIVNQSCDIVFEAKDKWTASCDADWLVFSPKEGDAGQQTITVATTSTNRTRSERVAELTISVGSTKQTVTLRHRAEYAYFTDEELRYPAEGGLMNLTFKTNYEDVAVYSTADLPNWVEVADGGSIHGIRTRADLTGTLKTLRVLPNTSKDARQGAFFLVMIDSLEQIMSLDTLFIYQDGKSSGYTSTDYSADGKVEVLNKSTAGKGIPVVIMGDGFVDKEIADGTYKKVMQKTMENFFSEEPLKSLREYFDVYAVTAVSKHDSFGGNNSTAVSAMPDVQTTGIYVDDAAVERYVRKVPGIDVNQSLAIVILNSTLDKGVTYMYYNSLVNTNFAIALCPMINGLDAERFRQTLTHEAVGHGFAKLADEYVRSTEGSATEEDIKELQKFHGWGWYLNVDSEKDPSKVLWSQFVTDSHFAVEKIGTYEGGYTYYKGVYRPTEESMMRHNDAPFNAPSRQAIYNRVMQYALGYTPTYEEFVTFDEKHKPSVWSYMARTRQQGKGTMELPHAHPIIKKR